MPIAVKDILELNEQECYVTLRTGAVDKIVLFLKENKNNAYSSREIAEELNKEKNKLPNKLNVKFSTNKIYYALAKLIKSKITNCHIKKKGSFYWYQED